MDIPTRSEAFLVESDASKAELVNPGEYRESTTPVEENISSTTGGVRTIPPGAGYFHIVIRATVPRGHPKWKGDCSTHSIQSIEEVDGHFVLSTTTTTGELVHFEIDHELAAFYYK